MSFHERKQIRDYVVSALKTPTVVGSTTTYPTDAQDRVFPSRVEPLLLKTIPAIAVYTPREPIDEKESSVWNDPDMPGHLKRQLFLHIACVAPGERSDDALDQMALQVETAIDRDTSFGLLIESEMLVDTELEFADDGQRLVGCLRLVYLIVYRTATRTPAATPGYPVSTVYGSWAPNIGTAHKDDYVVIADVNTPPPPPDDDML